MHHVQGAHVISLFRQLLIHVVSFTYYTFNLQVKASKLRVNRAPGRVRSSSSTSSSVTCASSLGRFSMTIRNRGAVASRVWLQPSLKKADRLVRAPFE